MATDIASLSSAGIDSDPWSSVQRQALDLAATLRDLAASRSPEVLDACSAYAAVADEIGRWASERGSSWPSHRLPPTLSLSQLQAFGHLLRDKRNQAGFSRVQLARKAKLSDATIKFIETARHPPSRATLLRLVGVAELGLRWADTPGSCAEVAPVCLDSADSTSLPVELHRFDSRLTLPLVLELMLLLDELRTTQYVTETTSYGVRRACRWCEARAEAWAVDARGAAKLPIRHAVSCVGRLADSLYQQHPAIKDLANQERRSLRSPLALALDASRRAAKPERFYGCRSGRQMAALLTRLTARPLTPYRKGASELLLWALALGPCPVEPTADPFTESRAGHLAEQLRGANETDSRLQGVSAAALWLLGTAEQEPEETPLTSVVDADIKILGSD